MKSVAIPSAAVALLLLCSAAAPAQSLADIARQEEARRKAIKASGKVYTNGTLRPDPQSPAGTPAATPPVQAPAPTPQAATGTPSSPAAVEPDAERPAAAAALKPEDNPKAQAYWTKRLTAERAGLARAQSFVEALQSRINALSTDFVNRDDPAQRAVIAGDRDKALAEQARVSAEILAHQKAIATLQEDGRRAGVPAGWVR